MVLKPALAALLLAATLPASASAPRAGGESKAIADAGAYVVRATNGENLALEAPVLPDLKGYTSEAIGDLIPKGQRGHATIRRMVEIETLHEFVGGTGRLSEWASRQTTNPQVILVEGGIMTLKDLAQNIGPEHFQAGEQGVYTLRLPLVVTNGATLIIDDKVRELRLSQEHGAFLSNDGLLFIRGTRVTGWSEAAGKPAAFRDPREFRPFLISWGGSKLYIDGSALTSLGYSAPKAYGISISQYSPHTDARLHRARPTGWILNSEFSDNWFGFYCYEADDIALIGNTYKDNIVYGIDPHDRSRRLIIANNTVTGARMKHGIIISREVNDSWIFGNKVSANHLSGVVIDRNSVNNVIAFNDLAKNGTDGLTIYESSKNLLWGNKAVGNGRHGYRMRNSIDIRLYENVAIANRLAGIYGHIKDLSGTDRDLRLDPFDPQSSMVVVGGQLIFNGSGPVTLDRPLSAELYKVEMLAPSKRVGIQMTGVLGRFQEQILDILVRQRAAAVIEPSGKQHDGNATPAPSPPKPVMPQTPAAQESGSAPAAPRTHAPATHGPAAHEPAAPDADPSDDDAPPGEDKDT